MAVDETRHHGLAARIDDPRARQIDIAIRYLDDDAVFDHDMMMIEQDPRTRSSTLPP